MLQCPACKIVFADVAAALLRPCPFVKGPDGVYPGNYLRNEVSSRIEQDEIARAAFAVQMHNNYLLFLIKLVVRWTGP